MSADTHRAFISAPPPTHPSANHLLTPASILLGHQALDHHGVLGWRLSIRSGKLLLHQDELMFSPLTKQDYLLVV